MWFQRITTGLAFSITIYCGEAQIKLSDTTVFNGMCDASAAVAVSSNGFLAADDEGNRFRLFQADAGGLPRQIVDLTAFLRLTGKHPEVDFEGACWLGDYVYWISSHGRNKDGKFRENRHRFFATTVKQAEKGVQVIPVGLCYKNLLTDFLLDARLLALNFAYASSLPPKAKGGLNIEGLCATSNGQLLIGFRNPIPKGRSLIVPLLNPSEVIRGRAARFDNPHLLDLGGLGVRDLGFHQGTVFILAGSYDSNKEFKLFHWKPGKTTPQEIRGIDFGKLRPEALVFYPNRSRCQILSDDGTRKLEGVKCKALVDPRLKRFRSAWLPLQK